MKTLFSISIISLAMAVNFLIAQSAAPTKMLSNNKDNAVIVLQHFSQKSYVPTGTGETNHFLEACRSKGAFAFDVKSTAHHHDGERGHFLLEEEVEEDPRHLLARFLQANEGSFIWNKNSCNMLSLSKKASSIQPEFIMGQGEKIRYFLLAEGVDGKS